MKYYRLRFEIIGIEFLSSRVYTDFEKRNIEETHAYKNSKHNLKFVEVTESNGEKK